MNADYKKLDDLHKMYCKIQSSNPDKAAKISVKMDLLIKRIKMAADKKMFAFLSEDLDLKQQRMITLGCMMFGCKGMSNEERTARRKHVIDNKRELLSLKPFAATKEDIDCIEDELSYCNTALNSLRPA